MNWIKKTGLTLSVLVLLFTVFQSSKTPSNTKKGILLVTFGSSYPAPHETFKTIHKAAALKFKDTEIRWAYTSDFILKKLRRGEGHGTLQGKIIDNNSPTQGLEELFEDGILSLALQSLHIIPGREYDDLLVDVKAFQDKHKDVHITVGTPLLDTDADVKEVAQILAKIFDKQIKEGPVCLMGHGTRHQADDRYTKLESALKKHNPLFFVGTVEGASFEANKTSIGAIIKQLDSLSSKPSIVTITPLMSIAGDHTNNDMNANTGETNIEAQSWRERLETAGYKVNSVMKGLGDYDEINAIWMAHLEASKAQ